MNPEQEGNLDTIAYVYYEVLKEMENLVVELLKKASEKCIPIIVTNAEAGWVEFTSAKLMPKVYYLINEKIPVLSTRRLVEEAIKNKGKISNQNFKLGVFSHIRNEETIFDFDELSNLIVIGDSNYEIDAANMLTKSLPSGFTKTIKLAEKPSPEEMIRQAKLMIEKWDYIVGQKKNMKIRMERHK